MGATAMKVHVRYFAVLRDQRKLAQETLETRAVNPGQLYDELCVAHGFTLTHNQVRFAINGSYVEPTTLLNDGDEVVFLPPVAGG